MAYGLDHGGAHQEGLGQGRVARDALQFVRDVLGAAGDVNGYALAREPAAADQPDGARRLRSGHGHRLASATPRCPLPSGLIARLGSYFCAPKTG